jgi:outer membrane receptor for ferric coprogen and ferric-rhodotorulic acid
MPLLHHRGTAHLRAALLGSCVLLAAPGVPARAQPVPGQATSSISIPPGPLTQGINRLAAQTGLQILFDAGLAQGRTSPGASGQLTAEAALRQLLVGSGLIYRMAGPNTATLSMPPIPGEGAVTQLPAVNVTGTLPGRTERTGSYGTDIVNIGRGERTLREIPQSVTVITRQQLDDQNLTTLNEAMSVTPGVTTARNDEGNERTEIFFRGFRTDSLQVDGLTLSGNNDVMTFDTSIYDRIEVLRGPAGLLQGAGEPGGTVNLVRKRPTDAWQAQGEALLGSWQRRRLTADVGGPLVESGRVRGRFVTTYDEGNSFVDLTNSQRWLGYGTLEFDLTDRTLLTVGGTWQENDGRSSRGLPAYGNGQLLNVPRNTFIGADWARSRTRSADVFANLEHRFEQGAVARLQGSYVDRWRNGRLAFANASVDPVTGNTELLPELRIDSERNYNLDANVTLPFQLGGLEHSLLIGSNYQHSTERLDRARGDGLVQNVFHPRYDLPEPDFVIDRWDEVVYEQYGVYSQARLKPVSWGTFVLGGRLSWWNTRSIDRESGERSSSSQVASQFTPYVGFIADLNDQLSAYVSYTGVFVPQAETTRDNTTLEPRQGNQYEIGLKAEWMGGRLNGRLSLFQIEDENRALADPVDDDFSVAAGKVRSRGFEAELVGEVTPEWQVIGGYTYLTSEYLDDSGTTFEPRAPMHSFRLWSRYSFRDGPLEGLSLGGGVTALSSTSREEEEGIRYTQTGYAVADLQVGYRFNENLQGRLTVSNLFDEKYYQSIGYSDRQNYYGTPRAFAVSLSTTW